MKLIMKVFKYVFLRNFIDLSNIFNRGIPIAELFVYIYRWTYEFSFNIIKLFLNYIFNLYTIPKYFYYPYISEIELSFNKNLKIFNL